MSSKYFSDFFFLNLQLCHKLPSSLPLIVLTNSLKLIKKDLNLCSSNHISKIWNKNPLVQVKCFRIIIRFYHELNGGRSVPRLYYQLRDIVIQQMLYPLRKWCHFQTTSKTVSNFQLSLSVYLDQSAQCIGVDKPHGKANRV